VDFYIRQNSDLPHMQLVFNRYTENDYLNILKASEISSIIKTYDNCKTLVKCGKVKLIEVPNCNDCPDKFFLSYKIPLILTKKIGKYRMKIIIINEEGQYILPLKEEIIINVIQ